MQQQYDHILNQIEQQHVLHRITSIANSLAARTTALVIAKTFMYTVTVAQPGMMYIVSMWKNHVMFVYYTGEAGQARRVQK